MWQAAPSTYYAAKTRARSPRRVRDDELEEHIVRIHAEHFRVYGVRKIWRQLRREGRQVARCTVARLMRELGLVGVVRGGVKRTTVPAELPGARPADLVDRDFTAPGPNRLWVGGRPHLRPNLGRVRLHRLRHRRLQPDDRGLAGCHPPAHRPRPGRVGDALWHRAERLDGLVHHNDRGSQYLSIRYADPLADVGAVASVGSKGDSFDNALAESVIGLFKTELIRARGPWRGLDDVEFATLEWVDLYNSPPPAQRLRRCPARRAEAAHYHRPGQQVLPGVN